MTNIDEGEIITIGDEILIGQTVDTNSAWIANKLNWIGIDVCKITSISDNKDEIFKALDNAKGNSDLVLITGGLGPTNDDITKQSLADYFGTSLVQNDEVLAHIEQFVIKRKVNMNERNVKQAEVPENCTILKNNIGTAPGMMFERDKQIIISMPGVPFEMKELMINQIIPLLQTKQKDFHIIHKVILTQGMGESSLAELIEDWESNLPKSISLAYLPSPGIIKLRLTIKGENKSLLENQINKQTSKLKNLIPDLICGYDVDKLEELIGVELKKKNYTVSTAESCTGGNIASLITSISGSSEYFKGSIVAYSNEIKQDLLKVNKRDIDTYGAVSKQVVEQMAIGVGKLLKTDCSIATSGIAGPTGGTLEKPIGTTWIAVAYKNKVISKLHVFGDQRERNIQRASLTALNMLLKLLKQK